MMKLPKTMNNAAKRARTPKMMRTAILAALAVAATACNNDLPDASGNTPHTPNGKTTIHVSAGQKADTRVAYEDAAAGEAGKLTWQTGDRLTVVRMNGSTATGKANDYLYQGIDGATSGDFTGTKIETAGNSWTVYYPHTVTVNDSDGSATLPMTGQTQAADNNTAHLRNYMLLACTDITDINSSFTLAMKSSIMKFDLKNVPAAVGKLKTLTWMVETAAATRSLTLNFVPDAVDFSNSGDAGTLTAFLSFMPQDMVVKASGKFTVVLTGDKTYQASATISGEKTYEAGKRYTATFDKNWDEIAMMALTVKVEDNGQGLDFQIPFGTSGTSPAALTIDWGDGTEPTTVGSGTFDANTFKHTYTAAGTYTITITSAQTDATQKQIPEFNFESGVDPSTAMQNAQKLISIDTPLLNTGATNFSLCFFGCKALTSIPQGLFNNNTVATNFSGCFYNCSNLTSIPQGLFNNNTVATTFSLCFFGCKALTSIPQGLFNNNTVATNFYGCFYGCKALTSIPQGLFDKNTEATDFSNCFSGCSMLESIPQGLFDKNTEATNFTNCFIDCSKLESIPQGLFDKNTEATDFSGCFSGCSKLTSIPQGLFDKNAKATNFSYCFKGCSKLESIPQGLFDYNTEATDFNNCFKGCSKLESIPEGLFNNNTKATNFKSCFAGCVQLALNEKIFSTGSDVERFADKTMNFTNCFQGVGTELGTNMGGDAPNLWGYNKGGATWTTKDCFTGATNLTNWTSIPEAWGGPSATRTLPLVPSRGSAL